MPFEIRAGQAIIATPFCEETVLAARGGATDGTRYFYFDNSSFKAAANARTVQLNPQSDLTERQIAEANLGPATYALHEIRPPTEPRVSGHVTASQLDHESDVRSVLSLCSAFEELGNSWVDVPSVVPAALSEASFASWPRSEFASTFSPSEVEAAEFAVPDGEVSDVGVIAAQARLDAQGVHDPTAAGSAARAAGRVWGLSGGAPRSRMLNPRFMHAAKYVHARIRRMGHTLYTAADNIHYYAILKVDTGQDYCWLAREFYGYGSSVPVWGDCRTEDDELTRKGEWSCLGGSRDVEVESADSFCCFLCGDEYASGPCGKCHAARGCSIIQPRCLFYTST